MARPHIPLSDDLLPIFEDYRRWRLALNSSTDISAIDNADEVYSLLKKIRIHLTYREWCVLKLRWGLHPTEYEHTLEEIAKFLGVTRERVRQIHDKAIRKIRRKNCILREAER